MALSKERFRNKYRPQRVFRGVLFLHILLLLVFITQTIVYGQNKPFTIKTYSIQSIPFKKYEVISKREDAVIVFAEYGTQAKVTYPAPTERIPDDITSIIEKCKESLKQDISKIIKAQKENKLIREYLTVGSKVPLFSKQDYLALIENPKEQNIQKAPETNKIIAEFRSQKLPIDENTAFCLYLTFIYEPEKESVKKTVVSVVRLKSKD